MDSCGLKEAQVKVHCGKYFILVVVKVSSGRLGFSKDDANTAVLTHQAKGLK